MLKEFATEVSKLINEALETLDAETDTVASEDVEAARNNPNEKSQPSGGEKAIVVL